MFVVALDVSVSLMNITSGATSDGCKRKNNNNYKNKVKCACAMQRCNRQPHGASSWAALVGKLNEKGTKAVQHKAEYVSGTWTKINNGNEKKQQKNKNEHGKEEKILCIAYTSYHNSHCW